MAISWGWVWGSVERAAGAGAGSCGSYKADYGMGRSRNSVGSAAIAAVGRPEAALRPFAGPGGVVVVPQVVRAAGPLAVDGTVEFFTARLPNPHTRAAYGRAVREFCTWCEECSVGLGQLSAPVVATYFQQLTLRVSPSSGNLHLSAVRQWLDWLTVRGALPFNPALSVRGAKVLRQEGKTPVLERDQTRVLFESLDGATDVVSLRDRAVLSVMLYAFVRAGALIQMKVQDFQVQGELAWLCLREKGGKQRRVPAHHLLRSHIEAYLEAAQFGASPVERRAPLFQSAPGSTKLPIREAA